MAKHPNYEAIAALHTPAGYTIGYVDGLASVGDSAQGSQNTEAKMIKAPRPTTLHALYVFLHECAHAHLKHRGHPRGSKKNIKLEMEATQWTFATMAKHNIPVSAKIMQSARDNVFKNILQAERHGAKNIDPRAEAFALGETIPIPKSVLRNRVHDGAWAVDVLKAAGVTAKQAAATALVCDIWDEGEREPTSDELAAAAPVFDIMDEEFASIDLDFDCHTIAVLLQSAKWPKKQSRSTS
jgi:hypothetical protein